MATIILLSRISNQEEPQNLPNDDKLTGKLYTYIGVYVTITKTLTLEKRK